MILHVCAPNDRNGNPRRLYANIAEEGYLAGLWVEGNQGIHAVPAELRHNRYPVRVNVTASEYRRWIALGIAFGKGEACPL